MAKFINCDTSGISIDAVLKSLMVTHDDGRKGFRAVIVDITECDDLNGGVDCDNQAESAEQMFRERIVLDPCGEPAVLIFNTAGAS